MCEQIKKRDSFADVDVENMAYIPYEPHLEVPRCTDYEYGVKREMVFRNTLTGKLERITYRFSGAVPSQSRPGYQWYWGDIISKDYHCCLVFYFFRDGSFKEVAASFCGDSLSAKEFQKISKGARYPAEVTARFF